MVVMPAMKIEAVGDVDRWLFAEFFGGDYTTYPLIHPNEMPVKNPVDGLGRYC